MSSPPSSPNNALTSPQGYFNWDGIFTVFTYTPTARGGLGLPVRRELPSPTTPHIESSDTHQVDIIGLLYSAESIVSIVANPLFLPKLQSSLGPRRALGLALTAWPVLSLLMPVSQWTAVHSRPLMWITMSLMMCLRTFGNFGWA